MRKKGFGSILALLALVGLLVASQASFASADGRKILQFDTMVGVPPAFTGATNAAVIRGVAGGGVPWMIAAGHGHLTANGRLNVTVRGLVLAATANAGSNPVDHFAAIVSCLTDTAQVMNVMTAAFPATTGPASAGGGDAHILATVTLPHPCIAPIVFVTSPGGSWFASTGG
jgi:hypothetical protein